MILPQLTSTDQSTLAIGYLSIGWLSAIYQLSWLAIDWLLAGYQLAIGHVLVGYWMGIGWQ